MMKKLQNLLIISLFIAGCSDDAPKEQVAFNASKLLDFKGIKIGSSKTDYELEHKLGVICQPFYCNGEIPIVGYHAKIEILKSGVSEGENVEKSKTENVVNSINVKFDSSHFSEINQTLTEKFGTPIINNDIHTSKLLGLEVKQELYVWKDRKESEMYLIQYGNTPSFSEIWLFNKDFAIGLENKYAVKKNDI